MSFLVQVWMKKNMIPCNYVQHMFGLLLVDSTDYLKSGQKLGFQLMLKRWYQPISGRVWSTNWLLLLVNLTTRTWLSKSKNSFGIWNSNQKSHFWYIEFEIQDIMILAQEFQELSEPPSGHINHVIKLTSC